jgi:cell division protein ZapA
MSTAGSDKASPEKGVARVNVRLLEKEYVVACPQNERSALLDSAELLNAKMREVRDSGKIIGLDRIAVIAALNLTNELLGLKSVERRVDEEFTGRIRAIRERVDTALAKGQQLEL